jgi:hypothetical protein
VVKVDRGRVFEVISDLDLLPVWSTITVETHGSPRKPVEEGDTFTETLSLLGQDLETNWRVTELAGGFVGELFDSAYAERRNERELEHSLHDLKELVETRAAQ